MIRVIFLKVHFFCSEENEVRGCRLVKRDGTTVIQEDLMFTFQNDSKWGGREVDGFNEYLEERDNGRRRTQR